MKSQLFLTLWNIEFTPKKINQRLPPNFIPQIKLEITPQNKLDFTPQIN